MSQMALDLVPNPNKIPCKINTKETRLCLVGNRTLPIRSNGQNIEHFVQLGTTITTDDDNPDLEVTEHTSSGYRKNRKDDCFPMSMWSSWIERRD